MKKVAHGRGILTPRHPGARFVSSGGAGRGLPRGRSALSRQEVDRSQRERILWAMAETMAAKGYGATSVADVLRAAGVSRRTFYEQFASKADCFMSAFEEAADVVFGPAFEQDGTSGEPLERFAAVTRPSASRPPPRG